MGCAASRLDKLPAVSLCHDRCQFLEEALRQSYVLADAHVAYMHSLKTLGPTLHRFFDQNLNHPDSNSNTVQTVVIKPNPSKPSSPDGHCPSSSNSESHIDFGSDSEDEEFGDKDFDFLHRIHPNYFTHQTPTPTRSYSFAYHRHEHYYENNNAELFRAQSPSPTWKTPSPPPPSSSTWDFLNFFESYERYELLTKDKEGIRDVKNEVHTDNKVSVKGEEDQSKAKLTVERGDVKQEEVQAVKTTVVLEKEQSKERNDPAESNNRSVQEVIREVEILFERAAESGNEVLKILDAGKFRYYHKNSVYQGVSSKMMHRVTPSLHFKNTESLSSAEKIGSGNLGFGEDLTLNSVNLSYTLKKLCLWEKKLLDEVKAEEKMRVTHAKNCRQMKSLVEKGIQANKVDSTRTLLRTLSTKIRVAIQAIDKISIIISKLRDEELWPQISDLIQKLLGMWKAMLECHRSQSKAVVEAKHLDVIASNGKFSGSHIEAAIQLKIELQNWSLSFSNWIIAQSGYVKALNSWLLRYLPCEPEEKPDDVPPLSPSNIGAPLVFVFCKQWSNAMDRVSEMEVIDAIHGFFKTVDHLVERHYEYHQQRLTTDKEMERKMKVLEREEQRMQKVMQARWKKMFLAAGDASSAPSPIEAVHQNEITSNSSLQSGLEQTFMAMERFFTKTVQAYEELHAQIEEGGIAENPKAT